MAIRNNGKEFQDVVSNTLLQDLILTNTEITEATSVSFSGQLGGVVGLEFLIFETGNANDIPTFDVNISLVCGATWNTLSTSTTTIDAVTKNTHSVTDLVDPDMTYADFRNANGYTITFTLPHTGDDYTAGIVVKKSLQG